MADVGNAGDQPTARFQHGRKMADSLPGINQMLENIEGENDPERALFTRNLLQECLVFKIALVNEIECTSRLLWIHHVGSAGFIDFAQCLYVGRGRADPAAKIEQASSHFRYDVNNIVADVIVI